MKVIMFEIIKLMRVIMFEIIRLMMRIIIFW